MVLGRNQVRILYPASLDLRGAPVLVVGGGEVAARKTGALLIAQARVTVIAPHFHAALDGLGDVTRIRMEKRKFRVGDLKGQRLVFAATDDPALNSRIAEAARRRGIFVNVAAPGEAGDFQVPSAIRRGRVMIAISTGGASAALARTLRQRIENAVGPEWGVLAALLDARRERILIKVQDAGLRRSLLTRLGSARWAAVIRRRGAAFVGHEMDRLIAKAAQRS